MGESVRAMVQTGAGKLELQRFDRPEIGDNDGLLRVEACGICGTDTETFRGAIPINYPVIPGHEPVGRIEEIGSRAAQRWGLEAGDRVVVQAEFGCGRCRGRVPSSIRRCARPTSRCPVSTMRPSSPATPRRMRFWTSTPRSALRSSR